MEQEIILNERNKQEYPPMHSTEIHTHLKHCGIAYILILSVILLFTSCDTSTKVVKNDVCCHTFFYEGIIIDSTDTPLNISLSLMTLLDSTIVGNYYHDTLPRVTYSLGGKVYPDNTFEIGEFRNDSLVFVWKGRKSDKGKTIDGIRTDIITGKKFTFKASIVFGKSYWDYIRQQANYISYTDMRDAFRHKKDVYKIDFEGQGLAYLPNEMAQLDKVESINLLGNNLDTFPPILAQMKNVFYLSLCSNRMSYIGSEIGEMTNMRVLIINMNHLRRLPKEIGNLTNLMYLDVGENPIDSLPEEIKNLTKLQVLHIDNWQPSSERFSDEYKKHIRELLPNCRIHFDKNDN